MEVQTTYVDLKTIGEKKKIILTYLGSHQQYIYNLHYKENTET